MRATDSTGPDLVGDDPKAELERRCDAIEAGYEFMLAYASQGLSTDAGDGSEIRRYLSGLDAALTGFPEFFGRFMQRLKLDSTEYLDFVSLFERDARATQVVIRIVLAQPSLSSQLVDNLNASIHLRTLLTNLFLIDEILKKHVVKAHGLSPEP